jgi:hypothetical protein
MVDPSGHVPQPATGSGPPQLGTGGTGTVIHIVIETLFLAANANNGQVFAYDLGSGYSIPGGGPSGRRAGRPDIVYVPDGTNTKFIYDIKSADENIQNGRDQVQRYLNACTRAGDTCARGQFYPTDPLTGAYIPVVPGISIIVWMDTLPDGSPTGVLVYKIIPDPASAYAAKKVTDLIKEKIKQGQQQPNPPQPGPIPPPQPSPPIPGLPAFPQPLANLAMPI